MMQVTVQHKDRKVDIRFPCGEDELQSKVDSLRTFDRNDLCLFIAQVYGPEELAVLQDRFIELDELNYLAKRLDGFWGDEYPRFIEALKLEGFHAVKDMINLTFNLEKYVLISNLVDPGEVGKEYVLQTQGSIPADDVDNPKYAEIGKRLLLSGNGIMTLHGLLFKNEETPWEEAYDGQTFPEYLYGPSIMTAELSYKGRKEYVYLPDSDLALEKAARRLGVENLDQCGFTNRERALNGTVFAAICDRMVQTEGLVALNHFIRVVGHHVNLEKMQRFHAALTAAKVDDAQDAVRIAKGVDSFHLIPGVKNVADLGRWWLHNRSEASISPQIEMFFDYEAYGEYLSDQWEVFYLQSGDCVFLDESISIAELLSRKTLYSKEQGEVFYLLSLRDKEQRLPVRYFRPGLELYSVTDEEGRLHYELDIRLYGKKPHEPSYSVSCGSLTRSFRERIGQENCAYINIHEYPFAVQMLQEGVAEDTGCYKEIKGLRYPLWKFKESFLQIIGAESFQIYQSSIASNQQKEDTMEIQAPQTQGNQFGGMQMGM